MKSFCFFTDRGEIVEHHEKDDAADTDQVCDLSARREAAKVVHDAQLLKSLFETIGPRYSERQGGYTRVLKLDRERAGDAAEMAIISLVEDVVVKKAPKAKAKASAKKIDITEAAADKA